MFLWIRTDPNKPELDYLTPEVNLLVEGGLFVPLCVTSPQATPGRRSAPMIWGSQALDFLAGGGAVARGFGSRFGGLVCRWVLVADVVSEGSEGLDFYFGDVTVFEGCGGVGGGAG